jgi:hypothetical protein
MFQIKVVEKIKTHILCSLKLCFSRKSCNLWDSVEKYPTVRQATDDNMVHVHCVLDTYGYKDTLSIVYVVLIAFPLQQWLHERASLLRL